MKVYVGYVLSDYSHALWMSSNRKTVKEAIDNYKKEGGTLTTWITAYDISNKQLIELDCD